MRVNRPLEDWGKLNGDVPAATAILDRFLHNAEVIAINDRSYRLKDRKPTPGSEKTKAETASEPVEKCASCKPLVGFNPPISGWIQPARGHRIAALQRGP